MHLDKEELGELFDKAQQQDKRDIMDRIWSMAVFHGWDVDMELLDKALVRNEEE